MNGDLLSDKCLRDLRYLIGDCSRTFWRRARTREAKKRDQNRRGSRSHLHKIYASMIDETRRFRSLRGFERNGNFSTVALLAEQAEADKNENEHKKKNDHNHPQLAERLPSKAWHAQIIVEGGNEWRFFRQLQ